MKKDARGQRGKHAEKLVEDLFKRWNENVAGFAWHRFPDTRASRGLIQAQPADYLVGQNHRAVFLEVKETTHDYRIAKDKVRQLPVLHKWEMAGIAAYVLVHHTSLAKWRVIRVRDMKPGRASWDISLWPAHEHAAQALSAVGLGPASLT